MRPATRAQAAVHEAAHFTLFECGGLVAFRAEISGSAFGRGGWGGAAGAWNEAYYGSSPQDCDPNALLPGAEATLGGPIAEELLGGGDAFASISELAEARIMVRHAAELLGRDLTKMWPETLSRAVVLVERHAGNILDVAGPLGRRRRVYRSEPSIRKILARVKQAPIDTGAVSERGVALAQKIEDAVKELGL